MELISYAFEEMEYDIIYGGCAKSNIESYRVMQKAGMVQNSFYENGNYIFSIDREAFLNQKVYGGIQLSDLKQLLDDFILNSKIFYMIILLESIFMALWQWDVIMKRRVILIYWLL